MLSLEKIAVAERPAPWLLWTNEFAGAGRDRELPIPRNVENEIGMKAAIFCSGVLRKMAEAGWRASVCGLQGP